MRRRATAIVCAGQGVDQIIHICRDQRCLVSLERYKDVAPRPAQVESYFETKNMTKHAKLFRNRVAGREETKQEREAGQGLDALARASLSSIFC
jgi:hypothetical protein